jgi:O-antigen/teichoic acid export membrane protein
MKKDYRFGKWRKDLFYQYLKIGFPLLIITVSISLISNYSIVFLKNYSSINEVGYFTGGLGLASVFVMIGGTAGDMFLPLFSKAFAEGDFNYIKKQLLKYEHFLFRFILPFLAVLSINSSFIIPFLLGDKYLPSVSIFSVLIFYSFFKIWTIPYYNLLNSMGKYNLNAFTNIMFAIIFYTVLILFVFPNLLNLGGLGLGYSLLILELVKLLTWYYLSNKVLHFKSDRGFWKFLLFIFIAYIFYSSINSYFISSSNSFIKILYIIVNFVSIYLLMYFFKLLKKDDFKFIAEIFNLKLMKNYVKTELKK